MDQMGYVFGCFFGKGPASWNMTLYLDQMEYVFGRFFWQGPALGNMYFEGYAFDQIIITFRLRSVMLICSNPGFAVISVGAPPQRTSETPSKKRSYLRQFAWGSHPQILLSPLRKKAIPSAICIEAPLLALRGAPPGAPPGAPHPQI